MSGLLNFPDGRAFAMGAAPYFIGAPGEAIAGRLLVELSVEGQQVVAALDTGGHYFICPTHSTLVRRAVCSQTGDFQPASLPEAAEVALAK